MSPGPLAQAVAQAKAGAEGRYPEQYEAEERILDAAVVRIGSRIGPGAALEGVEEVVDGDEDRREPRRPAIWVYAGETRQEAAGATWGNDVLVMDLALQADVRHKDPKTGSRLARKLATRASKELMRDDSGNRSLDLGLPAFVGDAWFFRSQKVPPIVAGQQSHVVTVRIRFRVIR